MSSDEATSDRRPATPCEPTVAVASGVTGKGGAPAGRRESWLRRLFARRNAAPRRRTAGRPARVLDGAVPDGEERFVRSGRIGEGGMATVELRIDRALRRKTAMKLLLPELESDVQAVQSFVREAQVTGQLAHPSIVPVYDLGTTREERPYFTMQLLAARTLTEVVGDLPAGALERGRLLDLLEIVLKVCDALAFAHEHGVIHRDVKPENVMVGDFGEVYLVDWGLARLTGRDGTPAGAGPEAVSSSFRRIWGTRIVGTPGYMSPEQATGAEVDERSDVFAVGALVYFLLARRPPHGGSSPQEVLAAARRCEVAPVREVVPAGAPRELERIISRALARRPEDRHQGVSELRQDLVAFMRGGSLPRVRFERGHEIVREGDAGEHAYIIVDGRCEVLKESAGQRRRIRTIGPGECFGETAIMAAAPRTASVVAVEDTVVERVTREELLEELDAMKPWVSVFLRSLAERFQERETTAREDR